MTWNVSIDDEQELKFVKPIFDALIKNNAPMELIKQVFYDVNIGEYFEYLPTPLKSEPEFLKECLKRNLISTGDLPLNLQNQEFISKELYLENIKTSFMELTKNLYPQDEEIVFNVLNKSYMAYEYIDNEFKDNSSLMIKCLQKNPEIFRFLKESIKEEFLNNEELVKETLKTKPEIFDQLPEENKYDTEILKAVLNTNKGYKLSQDYLNKSKDPEVALLALKIYDGARKKINQKYSSILKKNKINENCYNFLKIYLQHQRLELDLVKDNNDSLHKAKI